MGNGSRLPTCVDMGVNVKRVVDGVDGASSVICLAEGERTSVDAVGHHVGVTSQRDVAQSQVLTHRERKWSSDLHFIGRERNIQPFFKNTLTIPTLHTATCQCYYFIHLKKIGISHMSKLNVNVRCLYMEDALWVA